MLVAGKIDRKRCFPPAIRPSFFLLLSDILLPPPPPPSQEMGSKLVRRWKFFSSCIFLEEIRYNFSINEKLVSYIILILGYLYLKNSEISSSIFLLRTKFYFIFLTISKPTPIKINNPCLSLSFSFLFPSLFLWILSTANRAHYRVSLFMVGEQKMDAIVNSQNWEKTRKL